MKKQKKKLLESARRFEARKITVDLPKKTLPLKTQDQKYFIYENHIIQIKKFKPIVLL